MTTKFVPVGLFRMTVALTNSNGYPTGVTATPAAGSTNQALYIKTVQGAGWSQGEGKTEPFTGGDGQYGQYRFPDSSIKPFNIRTQQHDKTLQAMVSAININSTRNTRYSRTGNNPRLPALPTCMLILTSHLQSQDAATSGQNQYEHFVFPACTMEWQYGTAEYQTAHPSILRVTPTLSAKDHMGVAFGSADGYQDNMTDMFDFQSVYPIHITTFISDGAATTFNTFYKPISTVVTVATSANDMAKNGTLTALSAITLAGLATLSAAGTSGDVHVLQIEHNEVAA